MQKNDYWQAQFYDTKHSFVAQYGVSLIDFIQFKPNMRILDIGCGTGTLTNDLVRQQATVIGIDQSHNMIHEATKQFPHLQFEQADILTYTNDHPFDVLFSNAVLHWIQDAEAAVHQMYSLLADGGQLVIEFGGKGNVVQITDALISQIQRKGIYFGEDDFPWYFPSISEYTTMLEKAGFTVNLAHLYDRPTLLNGEDGLLNWLNMFSPTFFEKIDAKTKQTIIEQTEQQLRPSLYQNGQWIADYKRLRIVAVK